MTYNGRSSCRMAGGMRGRTTFTRRSSSCASASLTVMAISADTECKKGGVRGCEEQGGVGRASG